MLAVLAGGSVPTAAGLVPCSSYAKPGPASIGCLEVKLLLPHSSQGGSPYELKMLWFYQKDSIDELMLKD